MLLPARWHIISIISLSLLFFSLLLLLISPEKVSAQTENPTASQSANVKNNLFNTPNLNPDVPLNQHTFAQSAMIEVFSAAFCIVTGIDPINPRQGCLEIDHQTNKLGLSPQEDKPQIGGLLGIIPPAFEQIYTPPVSSSQYIAYVKDSFGLTKPAYAQQTSNVNGFASLTMLLPLWKVSLNISYFFLVLIFITIGLAIMLRVHIDPRTVMTIQNQIPRIIICILLTTFSFAIAGLMVDLMWLSTYTGINLITQNVSGANYQNCVDNIRERGNTVLMDNPPKYIDSVISCTGPGNNGLLAMTAGVSYIIRDLVGTTLSSLLNNGQNCNQGGCAGQVFIDAIRWLAFAFGWLIVIIALIIAAFRIWWMLLKAYILIIIYVITAPLMITMGLLPGKPLGFEKWLKRIFVALIVFPATALLICAAALLSGLYQGSNSNFLVPPLTGQPDPQNFGWFIAFGMVMVGPHLLEILQKNLQASSESGNAATQAVFAGAAYGRQGAKAIGKIPQGIASTGWKGLTRTHPMTGEAQGALAKWATRSDVAKRFGPTLTFLTGWDPRKHSGGGGSSRT